MQTIIRPVSAEISVPARGLGLVTLRVLRTREERAAIAGLRRLAPAGVEDDLGLQLAPHEAARDEAGIVAALFRDAQLIATIRFVPSGLGLTGAERLNARLAGSLDFLGPGNWEVGRLVMDPRERDPALLGRCLALALTELLRIRVVDNFYAIATPTMARLWRRFGMQIAADVQGSSGTPYVVVRGHVNDVAAALKVPRRRPIQAGRGADAASRGRRAVGRQPIPV